MLKEDVSTLLLVASAGKRKRGRRESKRNLPGRRNPFEGCRKVVYRLFDRLKHFHVDDDTDAVWEKWAHPLLAKK